MSSPPRFTAPPTPAFTRGWLVALVTVVALVAGCAQLQGQVADPRSETPDARTFNPIILPAEVLEERAEAGRGMCSPPGHPDVVATACCADAPCRGFCVSNVRTQQVYCRCFGTLGGCPEGTICCKRKGGCTSIEECVRAGPGQQR